MTGRKREAFTSFDQKRVYVLESDREGGETWPPFPPEVALVVTGAERDAFSAHWALHLGRELGPSDTLWRVVEVPTVSITPSRTS